MPTYTELSRSNFEEYFADDSFVEKFGSEIINLEPIQSGVSNSVYRVTTNSGNFIFKILEGNLDPNQNNLSLSKILTCLSDMRKAGALIPSCYLTDKKINGKDIVAFEFLEGDIKINLNYNELEKVGESLAKFHLSSKNTQTFQKNKNSFFNIVIDELAGSLKKIVNGENTSKQLKFLRGCGEYLLNKLSRDLRFFNISKNLPRGKIHQDLNATNFIFNNDKAFIVDFDRLNDGPFVKDIANAIFKLCIEPIGNKIDEQNPKKTKFCVDEKGIRSFLNGYNEARNLTKSEVKSIGFFLDLAANEMLVGYLKCQVLQKLGTFFLEIK